MALNENNLGQIKSRVLHMFMDTVRTLELIEENADEIFAENADEIRSSINECLNDFIRDREQSGELHPEQLIYDAPARNFQRSGFYGSQLDMKERQVTSVNIDLQDSMRQGIGRVFRKRFLKWIDVINNFLGSLISAVGIAEAFKELKDCLRDELPDQD